MQRKETPTDEVERAKLRRSDIVLRVVAVALAVWAAGLTALHLIPPRLEVSQKTLTIAREHIIAPKWTKDFDALASLPIWEHQRLQTLLTHVELAHYTVNELINWKMPGDVYRDYVLSPVITAGEHELNWRRELWENFWPRVRHEDTTSSTAEIVVEFLRERVTIAPKYPTQPGIESIWKGQIANRDDFDRVYVAALRSVGVPARLAPNHRAEFWTDEAWKPAPRPVIETWLE